MTELWMPGIPHDPGASSAQNASRLITLRAVTEHRTIGSWAGDYGVGKGRTHSSPGTFPFLVGQEWGQWVEFYAANVRCSHVAGGNYAGPGVEFSGQNGEPLTEWQILAGIAIHRFLASLGIPDNFYDGEWGRIWLDRHDYAGWITHRAVDYPPNTKFLHHDFITRPEWQRMLAAPPVPSSAPSSVPAASPTPVDWDSFRRWLIGVVKYDVAAGPTLKRGAFGTEVKSWQHALNLTTSPTWETALVVDGNFAAKTDWRTREWQAFWRLRVDGIVAAKSRGAMVHNLEMLG